MERTCLVAQLESIGLSNELMSLATWFRRIQSDTRTRVSFNGKTKKNLFHPVVGGIIILCKVQSVSSLFHYEVKNKGCHSAMEK